MAHKNRVIICFLTLIFLFPGISHAQNSLRFFGNGVNDIDRIKIPIDNPNRPADIGSTNFTLEFWMKTNEIYLPAPGNCTSNLEPFAYSYTIFDRNEYAGRSFGQYALTIRNKKLLFSVNNVQGDITLCGTSTVIGNGWHHIAITREILNGRIRLFVDGALDAEITGPSGRMDFLDGTASNNSNDPYLVIGAEKHDWDGNTGRFLYRAYRGLLDEVRLSDIIRYTGNFAMPLQAFAADSHTMALYHFDEGIGDFISDSSSAAGGPSNGIRNFGGNGIGPPGPEWVTDFPFTSNISVPILFDGKPFGMYPAGTTQAQLSLYTNKDATCRYSTAPNVPFQSMTGIFQFTGYQNHNSPTLNLQSGQSYKYYVKCQDSSGKTNAKDLIISFRVAALNASVFSFAVTNDGPKSITKGQSFTELITLSLTSGTAQPVNLLETSGLKYFSGANVTLNPLSCSPPCSAALSVKTNDSTRAGIYTAIIDGYSAVPGPYLWGLTASTIFNLTITNASINSCPWDLFPDGIPDGKITLGDVLFVLKDYGKMPGDAGYNPKENFNTNPQIDLGDVLTVLAHFGNCP